MPITLNQFKCSNGHSFEANAKLRTRCPECGVMTKRSFGAPVVKTEPEVKPEPIVKPDDKPEVKPDPKKPVLVRQGRPRMTATHKTPAKPKAKPLPPKKTLVGSKVAGGLVKTHTVKTRGSMPTIQGKPRRTAPARGSVGGHEVKKPYWHGVADKFGF